MSERERWLVLYDADCGFCKLCVTVLLTWDRRGRLCPRAIQSPETQELLSDLTGEGRLAEWHLIAPDGTRRSGGAGLPVVLRQLPGGVAPAVVLERVPGLTDRAYRWVAANRSTLSRFVPSAAKSRASDAVGRYEQSCA
jgi:predicted DCC family thiol-disulfide oxidoreductase YuxK